MSGLKVVTSNQGGSPESGKSLVGKVVAFIKNPKPARKRLAKQLRESVRPYFGVNSENPKIAEMWFAGRLMLQGSYDSEGMFITDAPKKVVDLKDLNDSHLRSLKPYFVFDEKRPKLLTMMYRGKKVCQWVQKPKIQLFPVKA